MLDSPTSSTHDRLTFDWNPTRRPDTVSFTMKTPLKRLSTILLGVVSLLISLASYAQQPAFLTNGLVAYYPFNGNANDESGNGNNGVPMNGCRIENGTAVFEATPSKILVSNPKNVPKGTSARSASF